MRHRQLIWNNPLYAENAVLLSWRLLFQVKIKAIVVSMTSINNITNKAKQVTLMTFFAIWLAFGYIYYYAEVLNEYDCSDTVRTQC